MPVRDVTEQGLVNAMTDAAKKGMSATNVSVVSLGGERHHTALFRKHVQRLDREEPNSRRGLSVGDTMTRRKPRTQAGFVERVRPRRQAILQRRVREQRDDEPKRATRYDGRAVSDRVRSRPERRCAYTDRYRVRRRLVALLRRGVVEVACVSKSGDESKPCGNSDLQRKSSTIPRAALASITGLFHIQPSRFTALPLFVSRSVTAL